MSILDILATLGLPVLAAFYIVDNIRQSAVKGSRARYVLTGWTWALLWPAYAAVAVEIAADLGHSWVSVALWAAHLVFVRIRHERMVRDDDDNPWRQLRRKITSAVKRLSQVRINVPSLAPSPAPTA
jgi:hypothetical protein